MIMETLEKKADHDNTDISLMTLYKLTAQLYRKIKKLIISIFDLIGILILSMILFLKKNLVWLSIALVVGLGLGVYGSYSGGPRYYAEMTVRTNFGSSRTLYNTLDYLNALIKENKTGNLAGILSVSEQEARCLIRFSAEPVKDELILTDLYKQIFLTINRNDRIRMDTFWTRTIKYEEFKDKLTKFDIPVHTITAVGIQPDIFQKIQQGLIHCISQNEVLKKNQDIGLQTQKDEENIVTSSILGLDTLRKVYNSRLQNPGRQQDNGSTNLNVLDRDLNTRVPELELYDKVLLLKDELRSIRNAAVDNQAIIQVYSGFSPEGKTMSLYRRGIADYAIKLTALTLIILIAIECYKALGRYEKKKKSFPG